MKTYNIPEKASVLIFDIDSTLYTCPEYAHEQIDSQVRFWAEQCGITPEEGRKRIASFRKQWAQDHGGQKISLGNLFTNFGVSIQTSIEWRKKLFDPAEYLSRNEDLIKTLQELSKKYSLICVTNNPVEPARRTLEVIGISDLFPDIIGLDTCMCSKPSEKILNLALETVSLRTGRSIKYSDCISIGDRYDIDLALALELGMGGILVTGAEEVLKLTDIL